ncbi:MAG TPA: hypothetical protein EYP54_03050 [Anaerolineales bacterium]|nr:hypothetical protein [Anaerolineales bacterium]
MSFGRERLRVTYEALEVRREILGLGRMRRYPAGRIEEMWVATPYPTAKEVEQGLLRLNGAGEVVAFGAGLTPQEAGEILQAIVSRFPNYRRALEA